MQAEYEAGVKEGALYSSYCPALQVSMAGAQLPREELLHVAREGSLMGHRKLLPEPPYPLRPLPFTGHSARILVNVRMLLECCVYMARMKLHVPYTACSIQHVYKRKIAESGLRNIK